MSICVLVYMQKYNLLTSSSLHLSLTWTQTQILLVSDPVFVSVRNVWTPQCFHTVLLVHLFVYEDILYYRRLCRRWLSVSVWDGKGGLMNSIKRQCSFFVVIGNSSSTISPHFKMCCIVGLTESSLSALRGISGQQICGNTWKSYRMFCRVPDVQRVLVHSFQWAYNTAVC